MVLSQYLFILATWCSVIIANVYCFLSVQFGRIAKFSLCTNTERGFRIPMTKSKSCRCLLPEVALCGSGPALASLWWNRAVWVRNTWSLVAAMRWLLTVLRLKEKAERAGWDSVHLDAGRHLDTAASIGPQRLRLLEQSVSLKQRNTRLSLWQTVCGTSICPLHKRVPNTQQHANPCSFETTHTMIPTKLNPFKISVIRLRY